MTVIEGPTGIRRARNEQAPEPLSRSGAVSVGEKEQTPRRRVRRKGARGSQTPTSPGSPLSDGRGAETVSGTKESASVAGTTKRKGMEAGQEVSSNDKVPDSGESVEKRDTVASPTKRGKRKRAKSPKAKAEEGQSPATTDAVAVEDAQASEAVKKEASEPGKVPAPAGRAAAQGIEPAANGPVSGHDGASEQVTAPVQTAKAQVVPARKSTQGPEVRRDEEPPAGDSKPESEPTNKPQHAAASGEAVSSASPAGGGAQKADTSGVQRPAVTGVEGQSPLGLDEGKSAGSETKPAPEAAKSVATSDGVSPSNVSDTESSKSPLDLDEGKSAVADGGETEEKKLATAKEDNTGLGPAPMSQTAALDAT